MEFLILKGALNIKGHRPSWGQTNADSLQVGKAQDWPRWLDSDTCVEKPCLWESYYTHRLQARPENSRRIQKAVMKVWSQEEHWENSLLEPRIKEENRGYGQTGLEILNVKSVLVSFQGQLRSCPSGCKGSWMESGVHIGCAKADPSSPPVPDSL